MLAVLNSGGRDRFQAFPDGPGAVDDAIHAPTNFHAYAACVRGVVCRDIREIPSGIQNVLLLLRGDFTDTQRALTALRRSGRRVAIAFKEAGTHQVAASLDDPRKLKRFLEICAAADLALASTPELVPLFHGTGVTHAAFIPTPYPVDNPRWDFSIPVEKQRGIFIGTREFAIPSRRHASALLAARNLSARTGEPVTVLNSEGRRGRARLAALDFPPDRLRIAEGRLPYSAYLRLMAAHRLVFQLDHSAVPGQVAGDALLCRLPCLGGDGAIDRLAFPPADPIALAIHLLTDEPARQATIAASQAQAAEKLSFRVANAALAKFFSEEKRERPQSL